MKIIAVDDEKLMLDNLRSCIEEAAPNADVISFRFPSEALKYVNDNKIDVAFLDIKMRGMDGLKLGKQIKMLQPKVNVIFCTGYSDYALQALNEVRCNGYLLKPVRTEDVVKELANLRIPISERSVKDADIYIQCFGNFQVFVNGQPLEFGTAKGKELFAYLVDKRGSAVTNGEIMANLWEDDADHSSYFKKSRKDLYDTLKAIGMDDVIVKSWGGLSLDRTKISCDFYEWCEGNADGIKAFSGEYMEQYSWAEVTKAAIANNFGV